MMCVHVNDFSGNRWCGRCRPNLGGVVIAQRRRGWVAGVWPPTAILGLSTASIAIWYCLGGNMVLPRD